MASQSLLIKGGTIVTADRTWKADILTQDGIIKEIGDNLENNSKAEVVDASGQPDPNAAHTVNFSLKGPGSIAAVGSGDVNNEEPYQSNQRKLFHGKALVVIRTRRTMGAITLAASAPGMKEASIQIRTVHAE